MYDVFVETGPKRRQTLVHALEPFGCVHHDATAEAAIAAMPGAIGEYLAFLRRHDEEVPAGEVSVRVVGEDTSGGFLGTAAFADDTPPPTPGECARWARWYAGLREEQFALLDTLPAEVLEAKPATGRPAGRILAHVLGADYSYVTTAGLRTAGLHALYAAADRAEDDVRAIAREFTAKVLERIAGMSAEERTALHQRSTGPWGVRRMFRALLEHNWEHYRELQRRLAAP